MPLILAAAAMMSVGAAVLAWRKNGIKTGGMTAHAGLGLALLAMVLAGSGSQSHSQDMAVGEPYDIYGHEIVFKGQEFAADLKEKYYIYMVDGQEVRARTKLHANGSDAAREPAIAKGLGGDVYIAPSPAKGNGGLEMVLKQGRMDMDDDFAYRFDKAEIDHQENGTLLVTAEVAITDGNKVEQAALNMLANADGGTSQPVEVFGGQKRLRLTGITQNLKQIRLEILPALTAEISQPITASVSVKPCIWLLWLGSIMVCIGTLWAAKR